LTVKLYFRSFLYSLLIKGCLVIELFIQTLSNNLYIYTNNAVYIPKNMKLCKYITAFQQPNNQSS